MAVSVPLLDGVFSPYVAFSDRLKKVTSEVRCGALATGAIGGPVSVFFLTPQRNAMTLSAKQYSLSYFGVYRQVFCHGFMNGWRGGLRPAFMAAPQFTAIGPVYLEMEKRTGSTSLSLLGAGFAESLLTYSVQTRNAQIQYNAALACPAGMVGGGRALALLPGNQLIGPGFTCHVFRNAIAMLGIRSLAPHSRPVVERIPGASRLNDEALDVCADFVSSFVAATLSMPFNQIYSWTVCTPELQQLSYARRAKESMRFLLHNYRERGLKLLGRDLAIRVSYTGVLFSMYRAFERRILS